MSCSGKPQQINTLISLAICVSEILEYTSVDQWNQVTTCDYPAYAGTRVVSADVLKSSRWVRGPNLLRTKRFPFVPNIDAVDNIKLGVITKEQADHSISSLTASSTKRVKEQSFNRDSFDAFSSDQKLLRVATHILRLLPPHESYRTVNGNITAPAELDEAERHLQYFVEENHLVLKEGTFLKIKPLIRAAVVLSLHNFLGLEVSSVRLVESDG